MTTAANATRERLEPRWRSARILAACGGVLVAIGWGLMIVGRPGVGAPMVVTGMAFSVLGFTFLGSFERLLLVRMVQDLPTARIRSAPQGYVEIAGIVQPGSTLVTCPDCGLRCCWFQIRRRKRRRITPASADDVVVDDGTGRCLLRLSGVELVSTRRKEGWHAHLLPGDPVHVLGEFRTGASAAPPGAASAALAVESVESNHAELVRRKLNWLKYTRPKETFDVNRDGRLDERELEAMARVAAQMVARDEARNAAAPPRPDSTVAKPRGETDLPFLVVVGTEREALGALRRGVVSYAISALLSLGIISAIILDISARPPKDGPNLVELLSTPAVPETPAPAAERPTPAEPAPVPVRTPRQQAGDLHRANRLEEAVAAYDALLLDDPYDGEVAFWRANALGQLRRQEEAVAGLQQSCDLGYGEACEMLRARYPDAAH